MTWKRIEYLLSGWMLVGGLSALLALPGLANTSSECLTEAIYFEAGSHGVAGRAAVGHTILNRVAHPDFPSDICAVIAEGESEKKCQFSYRCDGLAESYLYPSQLDRARKAARGILDGRIPDPTGGALFFHSERVAPGWFAIRERIGIFGGNVFYR